MIMNRILSSLLLAGGLICGLSSCNFDDNKPSGSLPYEDAVSSLDLLEASTRAYYLLLATEAYGPAAQGALYADAKGGDIKVIGTSNNFAPVVSFNTDRNSSASNNTYYIYSRTIGWVNKVLQNLDNVADKEDSPERFKQYVGEAYAMRAYAHFQLATYFCQLPVVAQDLNAENSGIPVQKEYSDQTVRQKRNTLKETYEFIIGDFEKALTLLPQTPQKSATVTQFNYWAVKALLSRVYLYMGDYNNALKFAVDVINNSGAKLYSVDDYVASWGNVGGSESLFEIATTDKTNPQRNALGYQTNPDGYAEAGASVAFLEFLKALPDGDIRKGMVTERADEKGKQKGFYTTKYMGRSGVTSPLYVNNGRVIRLSELYLIASEALLKGGSATGAKTADFYLNKLRENRIVGYTDVSGVTLGDVMNERRIEFFCENHRMFDLVRNKMDIHTTSIVGGVLKYDDPRVLMAIPEREITASKGAMVQNPGW